MVKVLKWLLGIVALLAALLYFGGMLLTPTFTVSRNASIDAPADKIYALLADPKRWREWSVWLQRDPAMTVTYEGPDSGVGAKWAWKSKSEGDGAMTFKEAKANQELGYELYFADFGTTSSGKFLLTPDGTRTRVTWTMNGNMGSNPLFRWMTLMADGMVGKDFDASLSGLKAVAEKR
jgi:uncharacterized protein YndB with AHSA1/START domain